MWLGPRAKVGGSGVGDEVAWGVGTGVPIGSGFLHAHVQHSPLLQQRQNWRALRLLGSVGSAGVLRFSMGAETDLSVTGVEVSDTAVKVSGTAVIFPGTGFIPTPNLILCDLPTPLSSQTHGKQILCQSGPAQHLQPLCFPESSGASSGEVESLNWRFRRGAGAKGLCTERRPSLFLHGWQAQKVWAQV